MKVAVLGPSAAAQDITAELENMGASVRLFDTWTNVTKRFLLPGQTPPGKTRFLDLFRVTYTVDPRNTLAESRAHNPEAYERLSAEFMASLDGTMEMFEDVDVVIDASEPLPRTTMGAGGAAVGEQRLRPGTVITAPFDTLENQLAAAQEIALVGSGTMAAEALLRIHSWLSSSPDHRLFLISSAPMPFKDLQQPELKQVLQQEANEQSQRIELFERKLAEWESHDDFIRAKMPRPEYPIPRFVVLSGHMVTVVDQLVDKTRTFLTCETIPWASGGMQPENNGLELKTIGVDHIVVATGSVRSWEKFPGLDLIRSSDGLDSRDAGGLHPEIGFFTLGDTPKLERRQSLLRELGRLFSPREDHP